MMLRVATAASSSRAAAAASVAIPAGCPRGTMLWSVRSSSSRQMLLGVQGGVCRTISPRGFASTGRPPMPRVLPPPPSSSSSGGATAAVPPAQQAQASVPPFKVQASSAGTGHIRDSAPGFYERIKDKTPVSWTSLFLAAVAAASVVSYYRIERERRLEAAMGKVVSSESTGWTPSPDFLAKRKFVPTQWGWFPVEDGFGARELLLLLLVACCCLFFALFVMALFSEIFFILLMMF
jgi:hypothetical protein